MSYLRLVFHMFVSLRFDWHSSHEAISLHAVLQQWFNCKLNSGENGQLASTTVTTIYEKQSIGFMGC